MTVMPHQSAEGDLWMRSKLLRPGPIPEPIRSSPLMRRGAFDIFEGLLEGNGHTLMLSEALQLYTTAQESYVALSDNEEVRGGVPARRFLSSSGGDVQDSFYHAEWMRRFLCEVTGALVLPTGERGTYSYYTRPGDYLALHRDVETCDLAVITCLSDISDQICDGGKLCLYPGRIAEPLSTIRESADEGALKLRLMPSQTIVMFGGIVPHTLLPIAPGQARIVSVLCYQVHSQH